MDVRNVNSSESMRKVCGTIQRLKEVQASVQALRLHLKCKDNEQLIADITSRSEEEIVKSLTVACRDAKEHTNDPILKGLGLMKLMQKFDKSSPELVGGLMRVALEHILSILERGIFDQRTLEGMALAYYIICLLIKQNGSVLKAKLEKVQGDLIEMSLEVFDLCIGWRVEQSSRTVGVTGIVGVLQWSTCRCIQELLLNAKRESAVALLEAMKKTLGNETAGRFYYFLCREVGRGEFAPCMTDIVDVFVKTAVLCDTNAIHPDCRTSIVVLLNSIRARFHKNSGAKRLPNSVAAQHHRPAPVKPSGILHYRLPLLPKAFLASRASRTQLPREQSANYENTTAGIVSALETARETARQVQVISSPRSTYTSEDRESGKAPKHESLWNYGDEKRLGESLSHKVSGTNKKRKIDKATSAEELTVGTQQHQLLRARRAGDKKANRCLGDRLLQKPS